MIALVTPPIGTPDTVPGDRWPADDAPGGVCEVDA